MPIFIYPHAGGQIRYVGRERFDNFFHGHMIAFPFEQMIAAMHVLTEGRSTAFPECGSLSRIGDWLGAVLVRADGRALGEARPSRAEARSRAERLAKDPRVIFSCDPDEDTLPTALGDPQVVYASDYPHWDAMTPWTVKVLAERGDLGDTAKRKIPGENAARFFNLPRPA